MWFDVVFRADSENDTDFAIWTRFGKENRSQYFIFMKNREKSADFEFSECYLDTKVNFFLKHFIAIL